MRVRLCSHTAMRVMVTFVSAVLAADLELCRADAGPVNALCPDCFMIDRETAQRRPDVLEGHAGINQGPDDHVAGGTREAVEVQDLHNLTILLDSPCQLSGFDQRVVALVRENEVIDDVDPHDVARMQHPMCQKEIFAAWRWIAGGMIVEKNDGRG